MKQTLIPLVVIIAALAHSSSHAETSHPIQTNKPMAQTAPSYTVPRFIKPVQCSFGKDCFVLLYTDRDPSPQEVDFGCGRMTYNGHTGTDFAIPDEQVMAQGIPVVAAADGKVLRVRDGEIDRKVSGRNEARIQNKECGNGVVIDHGQGWETQYCHLRRGSVVAKAGTQVQAGTVLGMVGQSGLASFPHVHFEVRYQRKPIDPFLGPNAQIDTNPGCNVPRQSMWVQNLPYVPTGLMSAGFSDRVPEVEDAEQGKISRSTLPTNASALIFWVRAYGVLKGDVEELRIIAPDGAIFANPQNTLSKPSRTWFSYTGKRSKPNQLLMSGKWRGEYKLRRGNQTMINIQREVVIKK